jgi:hypothetical protein
MTFQRTTGGCCTCEGVVLLADPMSQILMMPRLEAEKIKLSSQVSPTADTSE